MSRRMPKQDILYSYKFNIFYHLNAGRSYSQIGKIYGVSKKSVMRFVHCERYQEVMRLMEAGRNKAVYLEVLKDNRDIDLDGLITANEISSEDIKKEILKFSKLG
jgi:hypothetical protein